VHFKPITDCFSSCYQLGFPNGRVCAAESEMRITFRQVFQVRDSPCAKLGQVHRFCEKMPSWGNKNLKTANIGGIPLIPIKDF
jgi:hypothetical protein